MKPVLLLLAAAATIGAAPPRPATPYEAGGFEPNWVLRISGGRLTYDPGQEGVRPISMPLPRRRLVRNGYRYVTRQLTVDVRHVRCEDYDGRTYADTIRVSGIAEAGCGGTPIPPVELADTGWSVRYVDRTRLPDGGTELNVEFREGRVTLRAQCHVYSGAYRERRPLLHVAAIAESWAGCLPSAVERRIVEIMRTPLRMRFVDGDTLVLTNRTGSLRLLP